MNNSDVERLGFFCNYYFRKIFSLTTIDDQFRKRFYRVTRKAPVSIINESEEELTIHLFEKDLPGIQCCVRKNNSSDIQVFGQVFAEKEYGALVKKILDTGKNSVIKLIIDAGANVGYTSLFLHQYFPDACYVVIEPDEKNFEQIRKNFSKNKLTNTEMHLAGLWSSDRYLKVNRDSFGGKEWGFYVTEADSPTKLKGISLSTLLERSAFPLIDILKIDIEGGEKEIFSKEEIITPILQKTRFIAIEIHDGLADRQHILSILEKNNFSWFDHEELTIASNLSLIT